MSKLENIVPDVYVPPFFQGCYKTHLLSFKTFIRIELFLIPLGSKEEY